MSEAPLTHFAAIHGHQRQIEFLKSAVRRQRLPHALLFAGPDGIGKRSVAVAFAAWLQCEAGGDDACGGCAACRQVGAGTHPDLQLVAVAPGKKEIGIDRMREIKRFMQLQPLRGKAKIAIVDDAHALTAAAQNAVLKTLEEPPDRSFLLLIADNPDGLLPTVRSRCQRLQFAPLPTETVADILVTAHGIEPRAAHDLAVLAEGSPGRALSLSGGLGALDSGRLRELLAGLRGARYVRLMELANELTESDVDLSVTLELLLSHCRTEAMAALESELAAVRPAAVRSALARADAVHHAHTALRRSNPNRQLLLDALLLQLARP